MNLEELRAMVAKDLQLDGLPPETQEQIINQFTENTLKRVTLALFEKLPEGERAEFAKLGGAGDSEGVLKLFQKNIPDLDAFVRAEVQSEVEAFKKIQSNP